MSDALECQRLGMRGPRVALLHGWGWDGRLLAPLARTLGTHCRIIQPDLPGYGRNLGASCSGFSDCVDRLLPVLDGIDVVVGWSLGALLAIACAERLSVRRIALIGGTPCFMQAPGWPDGMTDERFNAFADAFDEQPQRTRTRFAALSALGDQDARGVRGAMASLLESSPQPSSVALAQGLDWLRDQDLRPVLAGLSAQCFFLHGEQDKVVSAAAARAAAQSCGARWHAVPGAGHLPWLRGGATVLRDWLCADD
jgi:pimeloyl-[acyl-carrier protein] methyl ester esterase